MHDAPEDNPYRPGHVDVAVERRHTTGRILLVVAFVLLAIDLYLLVGVVPKFKAMFDALKGELPALTQWVLFFSWQMQKWLILMVPVFGFAGWMAYRHAGRIPLLVHVSVVVALVGVLLLVPLSIFYPILQLQAAIRDAPPSDQPVESRSPE